MANVPVLPSSGPGGMLLPHMSARRRHEVVDTVHEMIGGTERMVAWAEKHPTEFYTQIWAKGLPKAVATEHSVSEGVEALWEKLDAQERANKALDITPRVVDIDK